MRVRELVMMAAAGLGAAALVVGGGGACTSTDSTYCDSQTPCGDSARPVCDLDTKTCVAAVDAGGQDAGADAAARDVGAADAAGDGPVQRDATPAQQDATPPQQDATPMPDAGCEAPLRECAGSCYELDDPNHCGASCETCGAPTNGAATCDGTACGFSCDGGYWKNGATCDPCTTITHCGAACTTCTAPLHGQATCDGTACGITCDASWWPNVTTCDPCNVAAHCGATCVACSGMTPDCAGGQSGKCVCNATSCAGVTPVCNLTTGVCRACAEHSECASGVCATTGACVPTTDLIYLDKGSASCSDSGSGTAAVPFCGLPKALAAAKTGPRHHVLARAGTYHVAATQEIDTYVVMIVGAAAEQTVFTQDTSGIPILRVSGTGDLSLSGVGLTGATGAGGNGITCESPSGAGPKVKVDRGNVSSNGGSGFYASQCALTITRSTVDQNGARGVIASGSTVVLRQTRLTRNPAGGLDLGGGTFDVENCLIAKNGNSGNAGYPAGAKLSTTSSGNRFVNNTVADNVGHSGIAAGGVWCVGSNLPYLTNVILWGNSPNQYVGCQPLCADIQGVTGFGVIDADPLFVAPSVLDYHLPVTPTASPCINAGCNSDAPTVDLDGFARSGEPDLGCYEAH